MNEKLLESLLSSIEHNLTDWIPLGVKELNVQTPAYCLFVWYQDYSGDFTPHIGVATTALLKKIESMRFEDATDKYDVIWRPQQQSVDLLKPEFLLLDECDVVENEVEDCYELLAKQSGLFDDVVDENDDESDDGDEAADDDDADDAEDVDVDEDEDAYDVNDDEDAAWDEVEEEDEEFETLTPFREMLHRVGANLQKVDWNKIMPVTDDFVVVVCDYVGYWLAEDFEKSVSPDKTKRLYEIGLLPPLEDE